MPWSLTLARTYATSHTSGVLTVRDENGVVRATYSTMELPWRNNNRSTSCIPEGMWHVAHGYSPRFKKTMLRLDDVQGRQGILIHSGTTTSDTLGCILVGRRSGIYRNVAAIFESRSAADELLGLLPEGELHPIRVAEARVLANEPVLAAAPAVVLPPVTTLPPVATAGGANTSILGDLAKIFLPGTSTTGAGGNWLAGQTSSGAFSLDMTGATKTDTQLGVLGQIKPVHMAALAGVGLLLLAPRNKSRA